MVEQVLTIMQFGLAALIILAMIRAFTGPTAADRLVAINFIVGQVILFILVSSPLHDLGLYIDVALVFVLGAFIASIGVLKLLEEGKL